MDYNKLRTFVEVARLGSISKTAYKLFRTQPAITQQIQSLEESLELKLLERKHGKVYLTKEGRSLFDYAQHRLQEIEDFMTEIKNESESLTGEIKIGSRPDIARHLLPEVIQRFKKSYPKVKLMIISGDAAETEHRVIHNEVDIGLQIIVQDHSLVKAYPVHSRPAILAAGAEYLERAGTPQKPLDLLDHHLIDFTENCDAIASWTRDLDKTVETALRKRWPNYICPDHGFAAELLKRNLGICAMPLYFIEKEYKSKKIKAIMPNLYKGELSFNVVVRKNSNPTTAERAFLDHLLDSKTS